MYKKSNHTKVLDIKHEAEQQILFYRELIIKSTNKKLFIVTDTEIKKQLIKIQDYFKDYQLAVYLFSFSSYIDVLLLENYNKSFLDEISKKIVTY